MPPTRMVRQMASWPASSAALLTRHERSIWLAIREYASTTTACRAWKDIGRYGVYTATC